MATKKILPLCLGYMVLSFIVLTLIFWVTTKDYAYNAPQKEMTGQVTNEENYEEWASLMIAKTKDEPVSPQGVYLLMDIFSVEHPDIVYAQMRLESGNFNSYLARENNNYFGMKHPYARETTSTGAKDGYASYDSWVDSVIDYSIWQSTYAKGLTEEQYYTMLSQRYAEDKQYCQKVKAIVNSIRN